MTKPIALAPDIPGISLLMMEYGGMAEAGCIHAAGRNHAEEAAGRGAQL